MANPTLVHPEKRDDRSGITIDAGGFAVDGKQLVKAQEANIVDAAAATAATTLTITGVALTDSSGGTASASDTLVDETSSYSEALGEANVATLAVAVEQNRVDLADAKVNYDKLITDVAAIRVALNLLLTALEAHGLLADA